MKKQMMTLAAVLMVGAAVTSCSSDSEMDSAKAPAVKTYTMTVSATKGGDETRALNLDGNKLNATWATTEHVYVKKGEIWADGSLQPQADDATATLTGTLSGVTIGASDEITLQFPKSGDITYAGQKGTLADIAENFDWATATAKVASVEDGKITVNGNVTFVNQQAIVKFTLKNGDADLSATKLVVNVGGTEYEVNPVSAASEIYAAIPGFTGQTITLTATVGSDTYTLTTSGNKSFANGSYYRVTAKMTEVVPAVPTTLAELKTWVKAGNTANTYYGYYVNSSGGIHSSYVSGDIGRVAYYQNSDVDTHADASGTRILVLAVENVGTGTYAWKNANSSGESAYNNTMAMNGLAFCQSHSDNSTDYPAAYQAYNWTKSRPDGSTNWFLPSYAQWGKMLTVAKQAGTGQITSGGYWSATEVLGAAGSAWYYYFGDSSWNNYYKGNPRNVRACFAY